MELLAPNMTNILISWKAIMKILLYDFTLVFESPKIIAMVTLQRSEDWC
jgi:hypothetical protein